ncbi:MAG TPA: hypothetical protein VGK67_39165 [Myxococcales bacterium]
MTRSGLALALALAVLASATSARADSPLTSIDLSAGYDDLPAVKAARASKKLQGSALEFLASANAPMDQQVAVAYAAGWGQQHANTFIEALAAAHQREAIALEAKDLVPAEKFLLGYLIALDKYLDLQPLQAGASGVRGMLPSKLVDEGAAAFPNDFAVQYVRALVDVQGRPVEKWCDIYKVPKKVLDRFPAAKRNLRPAAVQSAVDYLALYEQSCPGSKAAVDEKRAQLNQIYTLARVGPHLIAGTQGGVAVWDPAAPAKPVAIHPEFICNAIAWGGMAWAGCDQSVVRWDGKAFKSYLANKDNDAEYYHPMSGPDGSLWVRYGGKTFAYDKASDAFKPVQAPWPGGPYDALVTKQGEVWWIDFLNSFSNRQKTFQLKSAEYPGSDPRRFREDAAGRLWVEDFESGLYRFDPASGKFLHEDGLAQKGTGVAFDLKTERLWMLHYTEGPYLKTNGRVQQTFDMKQDGYLRDLLLDEDGTVWVGSHSGIVRMREKDGNWVMDRLRVR